MLRHRARARTRPLRHCDGGCRISAVGRATARSRRSVAPLRAATVRRPARRDPAPVQRPRPSRRLSRPRAGHPSQKNAPFRDVGT